MAYYNYNPYQQFMPQQYQQPQQPQIQSNIQWVQGIEAMKSYSVGAGQSILLMDSESQCFGIKAADASGMPLPLRIFDYTERTAQNAQKQPTTAVIDDSRYITREEFESRIAAIMTVKKEGAEDAE